MTNNAAIYYNPEGFSTSGSKIIWRQSAGKSFLQGFLKYSNVETFYGYTKKQEEFEHFKNNISQITQKVGMKTEWIVIKLDFFYLICCCTPAIDDKFINSCGIAIINR